MSGIVDMDERRVRISEICRAALDFDPSERMAFLDAVCEGDVDLRRDIESSLSQYGTDLTSSATATVAGADVARGPLAGRRLGAYELGPLLGAGGMGEVYAAYDPRLNREVAVKVVPAALAQDPRRLQRLEREARATAALNHPNILAVHDIGTQDGVPFVVMERVPGETLAQRIRRGRAPVAWSLSVGIQIADALSAVHAKAILHRDLKPGNVMLTPDGRVKVLDFGLARVPVDDSATTAHAPLSTSPGQIFGTPAYMAPEQFGGDVDHRADIYSLGVILFELVTGRRPFQGHDFTAVAVNRLSEPAPSADEIEPSVPVSVSGVIDRCLARNPADRPASAAALKSELEQLRASLGEAEPVAPNRLTVWLRRTIRNTRRRSRSQLALWGVAIVAAGVAGVMIWRPPPAPLVEDPIVAVLPFRNLSGQDANDYLAVGIADALTTRLSKVSSVSVVARETRRTSTQTGDRAALARELGANLLVEGSLQVNGDRLRADARLLAPDGAVLWAGTSEALATDLFGLERELAERLVDGLRVLVSNDERRQLTAPPTGNAAALDAYWRGIAFLERTDAAGLTQAIAGFEQAVTLDSAFALAHAGLGTAYIRMYNLANDGVWMTRAAAAASKALDLDPTQTEVRLVLANVYRSTGRNASAAEELRRVLADDPGNDEARWRLGLVFEGEGRKAEALEQYLAAVNQRPSYWRNHDVLGLFYYQAGRYEEARTAFARVAELRPDSAQALQRLGAANLALGDKAKAREIFERAIAITPDAGSYSNLGYIHYAEGRFEEAVRAYREAIRLRPNRAVYRRNLGDAYRKLGRPSEARAEYFEAVRLTQDALRVNPNDARVLGQLAVYEAKVGRRADAERHITTALGINPSDGEVLFRRAAVFVLSGNDGAALDALSKAVANGYSVDIVRDDDDFAALRSLAAFQSLISPQR